MFLNELNMFVESSRLIIRQLKEDDADFIIAVLNTEAFLVNVGDRQVKTREQALERMNGFYGEGYPTHGLFVVERKSDGIAIGTVSYLTRDELDYDDIGYAFLPEYWGQGYAIEATGAVLEHKITEGTKTVLGIVSKNNAPSIRLLEKLDFKITGEVVMDGDEESIYRMEFHANTN